VGGGVDELLDAAQDGGAVLVDGDGGDALLRHPPLGVGIGGNLVTVEEGVLVVVVGRVGGGGARRGGAPRLLPELLDDRDSLLGLESCPSGRS
jgi:hypothetical protein